MQCHDQPRLFRGFLRLTAVFTSIAAATVGLSRIDVLGGPWLRAHPYWIAAAILFTAIVPLVQLAVSERGDRAARKRLELENSVQVALASALVLLVNKGADWEKTGVQAFVLKRRWSGWRVRQEHVRLAKVRIAYVRASGIRWTRGKGAIGRCWATNSPQYIDVDCHFAQYAGYDTYRWSTLSEDERIGLSFEDFQQLEGKYGTVAAMPITTHDGRYIGCVTADAPPGADLPREEGFDALEIAAGVVNELLPR